MFRDSDEKYLKRVIGRNEVVLFLGAGFSLAAKNHLGENFPTGRRLGEKIWDFLKYSGPYDGTLLPEMYQAFVSAGVKKESKINFLRENLLSGEIPSCYDAIAFPFWYKIYTLNVDDILSKVFTREGRLIQELVFPKDEYKERDQSLDKQQIVYLHGKLPCDPADIIFSTKQYAKGQLKHQPLYGQFVYDYATKPTIFLGTDLNEQIFERYLEAREGREGYAELRPKSFLLAPNLSPVKVDNLRNLYNVHYIKATSEDFFEWLSKISDELPSKEEILRDTFPSLFIALQFLDRKKVASNSVYDFSKSFSRVPTDLELKDDRSAYLLGASPRWDDIFKDYDIPRKITAGVYEAIQAEFATTNKKIKKIKVYGILGTAGSGKSTIIKRLGLQLSQNGYTTFLSYSDFIPKPEIVVEVMSSIKQRVVLMFDNARNLLPQFKTLMDSLLALEFPPIIVLSLRTNYWDKLNYNLDPNIIEYQSFNIPDLDDDEINVLIEKLDKNNLLGILKGKSTRERFNAFKFKARKQILVAMKEATSGLKFNEIIKNEFDEISPKEAKLLCICIALNTELGFTNSKQDFVGFSKVNHGEALNYLNTVLNGTILWTGNKERFMLRHRILADYIIKSCADLESLKEAYIRVLSILAPELKNSSGYSRKFNLYKNLINHKILYQRFKNEIEHAREVYESIAEFFKDDLQYWLQYGSLEIEGEGGDLVLAENYLNQALSLKEESYFVKNALCNLYYRKAATYDVYDLAFEYKEKADSLAKELLLKIGSEDPHIHHIYCKGQYNFIIKWVTDLESRKLKLSELQKSINTAISLHPRDKKIETASVAINKAYAYLGINNSSIAMPEIEG